MCSGQYRNVGEAQSSGDATTRVFDVRAPSKHKIPSYTFRITRAVWTLEATCDERQSFLRQTRSYVLQKGKFWASIRGWGRKDSSMIAVCSASDPQAPLFTACWLDGKHVVCGSIPRVCWPAKPVRTSGSKVDRRAHMRTISKASAPPNPTWTSDASIFYFATYILTFPVVRYIKLKENPVVHAYFLLTHKPPTLCITSAKGDVGVTPEAWRRCRCRHN